MLDYTIGTLVDETLGPHQTTTSIYDLRTELQEMQESTQHLTVQRDQLRSQLILAEELNATLTAR